MKKIELILWFKCNTPCIFCAAGSMPGKEYATAEAARVLAEYRRQGVTQVDFGGGEPTVRNDLPALASAARELGYTSIGVKSNGLRFCYPEYAEQCMEAGINEFSISLWGHDAATHDAMAGRTGAFRMTEMGLKHLVDFGASVELDFLLTTATVPHVRAAIEKFNTKIGVKKFRLWLYSLFGADWKHTEFLPRLSDAGIAAAQAYEAMSDSVEWMKTSHIMPCLLGGHTGLYENIRDIGLIIVSAGGSFPGEHSPFETGIHVTACRTCRKNDYCPGPRGEYVEIFGDSEFKAIR